MARRDQAGQRTVCSDGKRGEVLANELDAHGHLVGLSRLVLAAPKPQCPNAGAPHGSGNAERSWRHWSWCELKRSGRVAGYLSREAHHRMPRHRVRWNLCVGCLTGIPVAVGNCVEHLHEGLVCEPTYVMRRLCNGERLVSPSLVLFARWYRSKMDRALDKRFAGPE